MMFFSSFARNYDRRYPYHPNFEHSSQQIGSSSQKSSQGDPSLTSKSAPAQEITRNSTKKESRDMSDSPVLEIFGINLYFDDILLICLIFFLFQEGVDDQWLYISLILLLLS